MRITPQDNRLSWPHSTPGTSWKGSGHLHAPDSHHDSKPIFQNILCMWMHVPSIYISSIRGVVWAVSSSARRCNVPPEQGRAQGKTQTLTLTWLRAGQGWQTKALYLAPGRDRLCICYVFWLLVLINSHGEAYKEQVWFNTWLSAELWGAACSWLEALAASTEPGLGLVVSKNQIKGRTGKKTAEFLKQHWHLQVSGRGTIIKSNCCYRMIIKISKRTDCIYHISICDWKSWRTQYEFC